MEMERSGRGNSSLKVTLKHKFSQFLFPSFESLPSYSEFRVMLGAIPLLIMD